ncbi:MAG TPA: primosomal replication protein N [Methylophilaceae bacterium]|nr:primosomal replication protein N [Methylophilaceae bacterium]
MATNLLVIQGELLKVEELRFTPAGIPILSLLIGHLSEQVEAGMKRRVECEVNAMVVGELATTCQSLKQGMVVKASGFLAKRGFKSTQLVMHINKLEQVSQG